MAQTAERAIAGQKPPGADNRIARISKCVADITLDCQKTPCGFVGSQIGRRDITAVLTVLTRTTSIGRHRFNA